jgi:Na+/proline symporter
MLPINADEAGSGLVPPAVAHELLGTAGSVMVLVMLFMAIVSTGSAESIAVSSLVAYDIYREYINPQATGDDILRVSRIVIVGFGLFMGCFSLALYELGLNLGWVYLFMGVVIGSAVIPLWNLLAWNKASDTGAVMAAWIGLFLGVFSWCAAAGMESQQLTVETLGTNTAMLTGNVVAICSSGIIHYVYSIIDNEEYDFSKLNRYIKLVDKDYQGLTDCERAPEMLARSERWITRRGYLITLLLVILWPLLSVPAGVFTKSYFSFWVLLAILWGFGAAVVIAVLPVVESYEEIDKAANSVRNWLFGRLDEELEETKSRQPEQMNALRTASDDTFKESNSDSDNERVNRIGAEHALNFVNDI